MSNIRTHYLDTSAIVRLLVDEPFSAALREYCAKQGVLSITAICFAETLGVLKMKSLRGLLTRDQYLATCAELMAYIRGETLVIDNVDITTQDTFDEVDSLATKYDLDVADAYQLVTLKRGMFSKMIDDSTAILVTADAALAGAARGEGLRAWECIHEPAP